ncbi:tetratricopeptide repeat protein [Caulobacter mirabilis]|uniref:Tetratricopeptide repeat protein 38 n=1 Tax=Caulobacter mirabilis TaxID=69666 RepID=A0A2D2AZ88_9CAUL|nr:tetratricopeptide repeat protein [Caulobacter mirabilis]ATQ43326.1 tetratricopeptide repeat protein 38 family protein [Caulobacter mirabilis]
MTTDSLGNPITDTGAAARAVDGFVQAFLGYEASAAEVLGAADAHSDSALLNAYAAALWLLLEAAEGRVRAAPYLRRAEAAPANGREALTVAFVRAWFDDDLPAAFTIADTIQTRHPRDLLLLKLRHYHEFNRGDFPAMLRSALAARAAAEDVAWLHGMLAFAYEQCHLLDDAEASARQALRLREKEPWAQHALAHVMLTQGRIDEGAAFLEAVEPTWTGLNSFMSTHLWWHQALFRLSQGRADEVLAIYDGGVWGVARDYSQDQVGAVSLLARIEFAGIDVGDRWRELGEFLAARAEDAELPFLSLQYLYGLARAGRPEAQTLFKAIVRRAETAPTHAREAWRDVAAPAALGVSAHAAGDYDTAIRGLREALPRLAEIGGSHAQRDFFEQILLDALIQGGRLVDAQQMLEVRRSFDPDGAPLNATLAEVYRRLGLDDQAEQAAARGRRRIARR